MTTETQKPLPPYVCMTYLICAKKHHWYPIGYMEAFSGDTAPEGFLVADGSPICRRTFSELFDVIGYSYTPTKIELPAKWWERLGRWIGMRIPARYKINKEWNMDLFCVPDCRDYFLVSR